MTTPTVQVPSDSSQAKEVVPAATQAEITPQLEAQIEGDTQWWGNQTNMRVDTDESNDDDSAISGFSDATSTTSARASVSDFVVGADGRRHHRYKQGKYFLPNDETEQERLDLQHQIWLMCMAHKLSLAPLKKEPRHVLDLGTGTGNWAMDYANQHPTADIIGTDLSPIQPDFIPLNCTFEIEDLEDEWTYTQLFDLIHGRALCSCMSNPKHMFEQAFAHLRPGGFMEMQDVDFPAICDDETLEGTVLKKWYDNIVEGMKKLGRDIGMTKSYKRWMEEVGFVNVQEHLLKWPIGTWPKDPFLKKLGFFCQQNSLEGINSIKAPLMRGLGWSLEEVDELLVGAKKDLRNRQIHSYMLIRVVVGMKPE